MKRVLDVGQCGMDHASIRGLLERNFDVEVAAAHSHEDALRALADGEFALVLVNRKMDADYSDGMEIVKSIKADAKLAATPVMLVTNYAEHQQAAVAAGAEPGFGKAQLNHPATIETLRKFLA